MLGSHRIRQNAVTDGTKTVFLHALSGVYGRKSLSLRCQWNETRNLSHRVKDASYNTMDLPTLVTFTDGNSLQMRYTSDGRRADGNTRGIVIEDGRKVLK